MEFGDSFYNIACDTQRLTAVMLQRRELLKKKKLHYCVFFSRKLALGRQFKTQGHGDYLFKKKKDK